MWCGEALVVENVGVGAGTYGAGLGVHARARRWSLSLMLPCMWVVGCGGAGIRDVVCLGMRATNRIAWVRLWVESCAWLWTLRTRNGGVRSGCWCWWRRWWCRCARCCWYWARCGC